VVVSASGVRVVGPARAFEVQPVPTLPAGTDVAAVAAFQQETAELLRRIGGAGAELARAGERLRHLRAALSSTPRADPGLHLALDSLARQADGLSLRLEGDRVRGRLSEPATPSVRGRARAVADGHWETRQAPTATQRRDLALARDGLEAVLRDLAALEAGLGRVEAAFAAAGAPWTPGRRLPP
jgi:hypothetical protein